MRGKPDDQAQIYYPIDVESWIAEDHPLRAVKRRADEVLASMRKDFDRACSKMGRPQRKMEVVLRLLRGEDLVEVSQETQVAPHELEEWRRVFIERGQQGLKSRSRDPGERELIRTRATLGKISPCVRKRSRDFPTVCRCRAPRPRAGFRCRRRTR